MHRKVSRRNTKRKTKSKTKNHRLSKRLSKNKSNKSSKKISKKLSKKISKKNPSASRGKKYTGKKLLPRRAIIFPDPIMMDGGGVDREMIGI
jgi:hypothetical protein